MAQPASRSDLINYCKRQLGAPVLEINVADEQIDDLIDDALQYFHERHFDGVTQTLLKYKITEGDINSCLLYTSPSPRDAHESRMPSSA